MRPVPARPWQFLLLTLLVALCLAPSARAENLADGEIHRDLQIGGAIVNVQYLNGKAYIVVKSGTLKLTSGTDKMADIAAPGAIAITGFPGMSIANGGLDLGSPILDSRGNWNCKIVLGGNTNDIDFTPPRINNRNWDSVLVTKSYQQKVTVDRRMRSTEMRYHGLSGESLSDRSQLSAIGG